MLYQSCLACRARIRPLPALLADAGQLGGTGRARGRNLQMQAIGTWVEGGGLIGLGQLVEGAALMAAALPADRRPPGRGTSTARPCCPPPTWPWARWTGAPCQANRCSPRQGRPTIRSPPRCSPELLRARRQGPRPRPGLPGPAAVRRPPLRRYPCRQRRRGALGDVGTLDDCRPADPVRHAGHGPHQGRPRTAATPCGHLCAHGSSPGPSGPTRPDIAPGAHDTRPGTSRTMVALVNASSA